MPESQLDTLVAYLRQHGGRFVVEALRNQMLSEGHDPALVEEAIRIYQAEKPAPPPRPVWPLALGIAFANLAAVVLFFAMFATFGESIGEPVGSNLVMLFLALFLLEPVVGVVLTMTGGRLRRTGLGLLLGWASFVGGGLLLLGGFCLFLFTAYN